MPVAKRKKNGRTQWVADYQDSGGHRRQKFFATKEAAEQHFAKAVLTARTRTASALSPDTTVKQYAERWLGMHPGKHGTLETYGDYLRLHILPALGGMRVVDVQRSRIKTFLADQKAKGQKRDTVKLQYKIIRAMLNGALDDELITSNPGAKLGKVLGLGQSGRGRSGAGDQKVKAMDLVQRDRFLAVAAKVEPGFAFLWEFAVKAGPRPGEVYALRESDLNLDQGQALIARTLSDDGKRIGTPKGNRERVIDLSAATIAGFRAHLAQRAKQKLRGDWREMPEPLFCSPMGAYLQPCDVRKAFARVLKAAKLPEHFSPHALRHTFASLLLASGVDVYYVCRMLGHASIDETVATYGSWLPANRRGVLDILDTAPSAQAVRS